MIKSDNIKMHLSKQICVFISLYFILGTVFSQQLNYSDQIIEIRNPQLKDGVKRAGESGVLFTSEIKFTYSSEQIKGAQDSQDPHEYYFFLNITDQKGNKVFYPSAIPDKLKKSLTRDEYVMLTADKTEYQYLRIFIPYNRLRLKEGLHSLNFKLECCNNSGTFYFRKLTESSINVKQPVVYVAQIGISHAEIIEDQYDMPGSKIPIIGLFVGGDKSKSGQGLPDAGWKVKVGGDIIFESPVTSNTFQVPEGVSSFRIAKGDPLEIQIIDEDYFKSDEVLGSIQFQMNEDHGRIDKKNISFGKIRNATLYYQQTKEPELKKLTVTHSPKKHNGVSGIEISVNYEIDKLIKDDAISFRPVFKDTLGNIHVPDFIKLVSGQLEVGKTGLLKTSTNGEYQQVFFIPHYSIMGNAFPGIEFYMDGYDIKIMDVFSPQKTPVIQSKVSDVKITTEGIEEVSYKGYWGLKIPINIEIPEMYYEDKDFTQLIHTITVKNGAGYDITDSIMVVSLKEETSLKNFQLRKINKNKILFIPYSKCFSTNESTNIQIQYKTRFWDSGVLIGDEKIMQSVKNPMLIHPDPFLISMKFSRKNIEYYYFKVFHGNNEVFQSEKVQGEKLQKIIDLRTEFVCLYDDFTIEVRGVDYFAEDKKIYRYSFTPFLLSKNVFPPFDTPKGFKSFKVSRKKIK